MDEKDTGPPDISRVDAHTSDRVERMTDEAREDLARKLAGRRRGVTDEGFRSPVVVPYVSGRGTAADDELAGEVARLTAELQRTERRLDRIERLSTRSRYQMTGGGSPSARY